MIKHILLSTIFALCCGTMFAQPHYGLQQLLDSARQNNIAIRTARHDMEAAGEQRKEAFTKYFPNVSGVGMWFNANQSLVKTTVTPSDMISPEAGAALASSMPVELLAELGNPIEIAKMKNGTVAGVTAVQPIYAGGQIVNGNRLARVGEEVSRLQMQLSEQEVELTAEQYFWQLASLQEKMKTVLAVDSLLADIRKDANVAVEAGVALTNDLLQVQLRQNEVQSQKLKLQNALSLMRLLLAQYCGLNDTAFVISYNVDASLPLGNKTDAAQGALATVEYQLLGKQVEATRLQKKMAVGQNLPTVSVGAGYNYHNLLDGNQSFGMVFATVSVPISDWWGGSHAIRRRKIEYQKAQEQLSDNTEMLKIRVMKAWNEVEESHQQLQLARLGIKQAQENLRLNQDQYAAGVIKMSDLLEAQMLYQQTRDRHCDAFSLYHIKLLEYRHATGQ